MYPSGTGGPPRAAIDVHGLSKRYGRRPAVTDVGFTVHPGQVCALLGPNGAGKTSTMRMLVGLSQPDRGSARILGEPVTCGAAILRQVGVLIDGPAFVPHLTGMRNLRLLRAATGLTWPPPTLADALDLAGLGDAIDRKVRSYSTGMKQRLALAQALMCDPVVLVLDEPANGLDPAEVRSLRQRLTDLARRGVAVLVSSHQLAEVQQLATHLVVMNHGTLVSSGPLDELLDQVGVHRFDVDDPSRAATLLRGHPGVTDVRVQGGCVAVTGGTVASQDLVRILVADGIGVTAAHQGRRTLEEVFLTMTGGDDEHAAR